MREFNRVYFSAIVTVGAFISGIAQGQEAYVGNWLGTLSVQGMELRILFKIAHSESDGLTANLRNEYTTTCEACRCL